MTQDISQFLPPGAKDGGTGPILPTLKSLGWQNCFAQQTDMDEMTERPPVRVTEVHRNGLRVLGEGIDMIIPPRSDATAGDWLLLDSTHPQSSRLLKRKSLIKRRAPGSDRQVQLIGANIDTVFIVSSCNQDFNVARLERYIALAREAEVTPVFVLTKIDLCKTPDDYVDDARTISDSVPIVVLDARGEEPRSKLADWCRPGQTIAFLGSSGVGKSTLVNALSGTQSIATQAIREDDAKGRHTTSGRQLYFLPNGCAVLDTPGIRELQLTDAASGVAEVFSDLIELASQCRFSDCQHATEPGCAVLAAIASGVLEPARLARWRKLMAEESHNSASLAEKRSKGRKLSKTIRLFQKQKKP